MRPRKPEGAETFADGSEARADPSRIRTTAVALLARREHSTRELGTKLTGRGFDPDAVAGVLEQLQKKGLVSDERYVTSFIGHHAERGQGPVRIRAELRGAGVDAELIDRLLDAAGIDWPETARTVRRKKFRSLPATFAERAKQARFLQYRGFSPDQIRAALESDAGDDPEFPSGTIPDD